MSAKDSFQQLVRNLKLSPTLETGITTKLVQEIWDCMREIKPQQGDEVTSAMLVALIPTVGTGVGIGVQTIKMRSHNEHCP